MLLAIAKRCRFVLLERNMNIQNGVAAPAAGLRWLFVDMNSFFASCEQQMNPDLRGQPVAVAPLLVDTTCAIAASYEAKAFGIKTGTPIWEARKRCPHINVVQAQPKLYVEYHHRICDAIESRIPIDAVMSIDEVACKLDRVQVQPHVARALALDIKMAIRGRALHSCVRSASRRTSCWQNWRAICKSRTVLPCCGRKICRRQFFL
jgi:DNA polymerase-4